MVKVPTYSDLQYKFSNLRLGESYGWRFTEANTTSNGYGRLALGLLIRATKTSEGFRVLLGEEDGNYAGDSWEGSFQDVSSATFFAYALIKKFAGKELDGKVEEKDGVY
jgi:hypothetical protein